jgi:riboflavin biosynthesis pyrimidine reductase
MSLGEGTNAEALLAAIAGEKPTSFKIIWAQGGPIANYQPGDTLLIDEIVITIAPFD